MFAARFILFAVVLAQLADAFTFVLGVSRFGIGLESNGLAVMLYRFGGLDTVLMVKGAVIVGVVLLLATTAPRLPRLMTWGGATATSMGLLGFAVNSASMAILS